MRVIWFQDLKEWVVRGYSRKRKAKLIMMLRDSDSRLLGRNEPQPPPQLQTWEQLRPPIWETIRPKSPQPSPPPTQKPGEPPKLKKIMWL